MNDDFFKPGNGRRDAANHDAVDHGAIDHDAVNQGAINDIGTFFRRLQWALLLLGAGALIWVLTPVLFRSADCCKARTMKCFLPKPKKYPMCFTK